LRAALTFVKPGVKIDPTSGRALDDHLRFEEMARTGAVLTAPFTVTLPVEPDARSAAVALLIASTQMVERLGGNRRRGAGRCSLEIVGADVMVAVNWLEQHPQPPALPVISPPLATTPASLTTVKEWQAIPFALVLFEPLAISSRTVGNVAESLDFVPGTFLLPHFTAVLARLGLDVRTAITRGDLRVLPVVKEVAGTRGRPVPLAFSQQKEGGSLEKPGTVVNRLLPANSAEGGTPQVKQCREGYLASSTDPARMPAHIKVPMTLRTHNTIDEESQRPTEEVGGVFSYEAISVQRLRGELRLRKEIADQLTSHANWKTVLEGHCRLGRSKKDDYGSVILNILANPGPIPKPMAVSGQQLFVWLLSDVLIRDERLRPAPTPEALGTELGRTLGVSLTLKTALSRVRRTESWHVGWGLPRPSLVALQAGTCVVFETDGAVAAESLASVEAAGIGERTAEGYGQICFNDPLIMGPPAVLKEPIQVAGDGPEILSAISSADATYQYACRIEEEVWRNAIRQAVLKVAQDKDRRRNLLGWYESKPSMSQLGGLRGVVQQMRTWNDRAMVLEWLQHLEARRQDRWNGSIGKVKPLFQQEQFIWDVLEPQDWPILTENAANRLRTLLWPLAVRSLIDACIRAHKREQDMAEQGRE
jgi:CRISPR-associated protein Csx10